MLVIPLSPRLKVPTRPFTPKVLRAKECIPTFHPSVVFTLDLYFSLSRSFGVCQLGMILKDFNRPIKPLTKLGSFLLWKITNPLS
jgi:hypothetical protein